MFDDETSTSVNMAYIEIPIMLVIVEIISS